MPKAILKICCALALAAYALFVLPASRADAENFAGQWSVSGTMGATVVTSLSAVCTLRQSGNVLAGSCNGANGGGAAAGYFNGARVLLQCHVLASNGRGLTTMMTLHGTMLSAHLIRGTWTISARPGVTGTFSAIRA